MHYNRWIVDGDPGPAGHKPKATFWALVDKGGADGCWLWVGALDKKGYGRWRRQAPHRYAYEQARGPILDGLQIDHLCRVRHCVNPAHLEAVTLRENLARSTNYAAIGILYNTCIRGHEFTPENTDWRKDRPVSRRCRTCAREGNRRRRQQAQQEAAPSSAPPEGA